MTYVKAEELMVLDAMNIASTIYARRDEWWTRAEDIARVAREDERLRDEWGALLDQISETRQVGMWLRRMHGHHWTRSEPLVEARNGRRTLWRMSKKGLGVLCA